MRRTRRVASTAVCASLHRAAGPRHREPSHVRLRGTSYPLRAAAFWLACLSACGGQTSSEASASARDGSGGKRAAATSLGGDSAAGRGASGGGTELALTGGSAGAASGATANGGNAVCGTAVCGPKSCGTVVDDCGNSVNCGCQNCISPACVPIPDCASIGKNCGFIADGCGGVLVCGSCAAPECCGCSGEPGVCGGSSFSPAWLPGCIAGSKGCLCDSLGNCAPSLACTPQAAPNPNLCCDGTDCAATSSSQTRLAGCGADTANTTCVPGPTIPAAAGSLDSCGYTATSFNDRAMICGIAAVGGGAEPAQIQTFFNDEHALMLGCATSTYPVSPLLSSPGAVYYPQTGDPNCVDTAGRPLRPSLYITDITGDPNCRAGDQQQGGTAYDPVAVFGTWKSGTMTTSGTGLPVSADPSTTNLWNLGPTADPVPADATAACPCTAGSCVTTGDTGRGFGAEVRFEVALVPGHTYRVQVMVQNGDVTTGGNAGEACAIFCVASTSEVPLTCADYPPGTCGQQPDGLGGLTPNCGPCCARPLTCEQACASPVGDSPTCQTTYDPMNCMIRSCPQSDGCGGTIPCWCNLV
jgi:hypothetical protein